MNKIYKTVWNASLACVQVVSELAIGHQSSGGVAGAVQLGLQRFAFFNLALLPMMVWAAVNPNALPQGGNITQGSGQIQQQGNVLNIQQNSQNLHTQWNSFNIGKDATVNFKQPNSSAVAVNQVLDNNASQIMGRLNANGQVFLLNPNGVIFSKTAQVNVGGLVASTLKLSEQDALTGRFKLQGDAKSHARVENHGSIIANGGTVALIAPNVVNTGSIKTANGVTHLTSANQVTLALQDGSLTQFQVDQGVVQGLVDNQGAIVADNGAVYLTAKGKDALSRAVVNHSGIIEANRLSHNAKGEVILLADMQTGQANVSGRISAQGMNEQDGGFIETSAAVINIADSADITTLSAQGKTGEWLIDPFNVIISNDNSAGSQNSKNTFNPSQNDSIINVGTLQNALANNNITVTTAGSGTQEGNITVADAVTWSAPTDLTLSAHNNIYINADITSTDTTETAGLNLEYGQANKAAGNKSDYYLAKGVKVNLQEGQNFSTKLGSDGGKIDYTVITDLGKAGSTTGKDLQGINGGLAKNYVLGADIDASATATWNKSGQSYLGFKPLGGDNLALFTGSRFDGLGHSIAGLTINRPNENYGGLFGRTSGSDIRNVHLQDGVVNGKQYAGGLVGYSSNGTISNSSASSDIIVRTGSGSAFAGGLVGYSSSNVTISNSSASGDVLMNSTSTSTSTTTTYASAGGLVGENQGVISNSFASGNITSDAKKNADAGGLVGWNENGTISNSYASGDATSNATSGAYAGGLVGYTGGKGSLSKSFASGNVTANATSGAYSGGLVGASNGNGNISNAYASGMVTGNENVGGLVGYLYGTSHIAQSYAVGKVTGAGSTVGGLVGSKTTNATVASSFWDKESTGQSKSAGGNGVNTAQIMDINTFKNAGWDIDDAGGTGKVWRMYLGQTAPLLRSFLKQKVISNSDVNQSIVYDGQNHHINLFTGQDGMLATTNVFAKNVGSYNNTYYSNQWGYDLIGARQGTLSITKAPLTVTANKDSKTYDGTIYGNGYANGRGNDVVYSGFVNGETKSVLSGSLVYGGSAQNARNVGSYDIGVGGLSAQNYQLTYVNGILDIDKATLDLQAASDSRTYNGTNTSNGKVTATGLFGTDKVTGLSQSFDSRNAGSRDLLVNNGYVVDDGNGGLNYAVVTHTASGNIAKATLDLQAASDSRTYNGTNTSNGKVTATGLFGTDKVTGLSQSFDSRNAGSRDLLVNNGYVVDDGNGGLNYAVVTHTASGNIAKATLDLQAASDSRTYNGTVASNGTVGVIGLFGTDKVTGLSQSFDSRNAGSRDLLVNGGYQVNDGNNGGNYTVVTHKASGNIAKATLDLQAASDSRTYNGTVASNGTVGVSGLFGTDQVTGLSQSFDSHNAGSRDLLVNGGYVVDDGNGGNNYAVVTHTASGNIAKATLDLQAASDSRTYNGTNTSNGKVTATGLFGTDKVTGLSQSFDSRNAGSRDLLVNNGYVVDDSNGGLNYAVVTHTASGNIAKATLDLQAASDSRTYNGTVASNGTVGVTGLFGTDKVTGLSQSFDSRNAGSRDLLVSSGYVVDDGNGGNNYDVVTHTASGNIAKATLDLQAASDSRIYDGSNASGVQVIVNGLQGQDSVSKLSQSFDSRNAGSRDLLVNGGYVVDDGNGGNNYTVKTHTASGNIAKATLDLQAASDSRSYNGTNMSNGKVITTGLFGTDQVIGLSQSFDSRNAGSRDLLVNGGYVVDDGNGGNNYAVVTHTASGNIAKATLDLQAASDSRTYNGTNTSNGKVTATGLFGTDKVTGLSQSFDSRNAGSRDLLVNNGYVVDDGNGGLNYAVVTHTASGNIAKATLDLQAASDSRTYNGTVASNGTVTATGLFGTDKVTGLSQSFDSRNAGSRDLLVNGGYVVNDGNGGLNYTVKTHTASGNIAKATLDLQAATDSRTYNGTVASNGTVGVTGLFGTDKVIGLSQSFDSRNAGSRDLLVNGGYQVNDGNNGGNYDVVTHTASGNIAKATLDLQAATDSRTYNGTVASNGTVGVTGLFGTDKVIGLSQSFDSRNAGSRDLLVSSGYVVDDGNGGNNYDVVTHTASGNIAKATLDLQAASDSRIYDGSNASGVQVIVNGLQGQDSVSKLSQSFDSRNAGSRDLLVNGGYVVDDGNGGNNYDVVTHTASGNIAKATLDLQAATDSRTYNGTVASNGTVGVTGLFGTDKVIGLSQSFDSRNAGSRDLLVNGGYQVNDGNNGGNYDVVTHTASGNIAKATLDLQAASDSRTYNGTVASNGTVTATGLFGTDKVIGLSQSFDSRNAGSRDLLVNGGYVVDDGNNGGNYDVVTHTASGNIAKATLDLQAASDSRTYNGTDVSNGTVGVSGLFGTDKVTGLSQSFDSRNAGARDLLVNGDYKVNDGNNGGNYDVVTHTASGNISKATLDLQAASDNRTYNATTASNGKVSVSGLFGTDQVSGLSQSFDNRNAGSRDLLVNGDYKVNDGNNGGNYNVVTHTASGNIAKAKLDTVTGVGALDRAYNSLLGVDLDYSQARIVGTLFGADQVSVAHTGTGTMANKRAGMNKQVNIQGLGLSGADAGNYELSDSTAQTQVDISKASIGSVSGLKGIDRQVNGSNSVAIDVSGAQLSQVVAGDQVFVSGAQGSVANNQVGTHLVSITDIDLAGADADNYAWDFAPTTTTVNIVAVPTVPPTVPPTVAPSSAPQVAFSYANPYQRAIDFDEDRLKNPLNGNPVEIEIIGNGVNTDGIQTLSGELR